MSRPYHNNHHGRPDRTNYNNRNNYNNPHRQPYNQNMDYPESSNAYNNSNGYNAHTNSYRRPSPPMLNPPPAHRGPAIPAYGQDDRKVPANFMMNQFQEPTVEKYESSLAAKNQEDQLKKLQQQVERMKRKVEERSEYSIKRVQPFSRTPKNKKKHKSSKKKKRSDSPRQPTAGPSTPVVGMFHVSVNPWSLLKERDYAYKNTHFVLDERADPQNRNFDEVYKHHKAAHKTLSHALSSTFDLIQLETPKESTTSDKFRFFNRDNMKRWNMQKVERVFRAEEPIGMANVSRVPLSLEPLTVDEIARMKKLVTQEQLRHIDLTAYKNLKDSTQMSFEEADLEAKRQILHARCHDQNTYKDVNSWIAFSNIQDQLMAKKSMQAVHRVGRKVELELEQLRLIEDYHGAGSFQVKSKLNEMENTFMSSLKMWKLNIKMRQNDRTSFNLESHLKLIDRCIFKLVSIRVGDIVSHKAEPNTDEFLVDMVVQRTKLLIECGYVDRAIASVQAVATFQFLNHKVNCKDSKPRDTFSRLHGLFKTFWETCPPRIGEQGAKSIPSSDYTITVQTETEILVEALRSQLFWRPVRNVAVPEEYYDYPSRNVDFAIINPVLFPILDKNLAFQFVFQLLQLFGAVIPGMELTSQEAILRQFSPDLFPNFSLKLHKFSDFLDNFLDLFSNVEGGDKLRVISAKILSRIQLEVLQPDLSKAEKKSKMAGLVAGVVNHSADISEVDKEILMYQITQMNELVNPDAKHSKLFKFACDRLFDTTYSNIWTMTNNRDRLLHLKLVQFYCRSLPYSDDPDIGPTTLTKRKFLTSLGINGTAPAIDYNWDNERTAANNWMNRLNVDEITLELASTFAYEVAPGALQNKLTEFDNVFQKSKLAKAVGLSAAVLKHKFYPKTLAAHLIQSMQRFPHKVSFVKNFLALRNTFNARFFLQTNPGNQSDPTDEVAKRIRTCAKVFLEWKNLLEAQDPESQESSLEVLRKVTEAAADEQTNNSMPDAYLWCLMLYVEQEKALSSRWTRCSTWAKNSVLGANSSC
uniref:Uncharacterized protein n=1 Tax=Ditylenchus dipsaci TaxID=166011 RepID=A0A915ED58_9BILA